jgi:hypothetical protein
MGARPLYLTCGFVIEEGYPLDKLREVVGANQGSVYNVNVYGAPGMNVNELADAVQQRLADLQRQKEAVYA